MKRFLSYIVLGIILIAIYLPGFARLQQLREENRILDDKIAALKVSNDDLTTRIRKLETDPVYVESVIREKLKKSKKGEIIYKTQ